MSRPALLYRLCCDWVVTVILIREIRGLEDSTAVTPFGALPGNKWPLGLSRSPYRTARP